MLNRIPGDGLLDGVEREAQTAVGEREGLCGRHEFGPVGDEGGLHGGVHARHGFGGGGGGGEGFPVVEDEVPAAVEIFPGKGARREGCHA